MSKTCKLLNNIEKSLEKYQEIEEKILKDFKTEFSSSIGKLIELFNEKAKIEGQIVKNKTKKNKLKKEQNYIEKLYKNKGYSNPEFISDKNKIGNYFVSQLYKNFKQLNINKLSPIISKDLSTQSQYKLHQAIISGSKENIINTFKKLIKDTYKNGSAIQEKMLNTIEIILKNKVFNNEDNNLIDLNNINKVISSFRVDLNNELNSSELGILPFLEYDEKEELYKFNDVIKSFLPLIIPAFIAKISDPMSMTEDTVAKLLGFRDANQAREQLEDDFDYYVEEFRSKGYPTRELEEFLSDQLFNYIGLKPNDLNYTIGEVNNIKRIIGNTLLQLLAHKDTLIGNKLKVIKNQVQHIDENKQAFNVFKLASDTGSDLPIHQQIFQDLRTFNSMTQRLFSLSSNIKEPTTEPIKYPETSVKKHENYQVDDISADFTDKENHVKYIKNKVYKFYQNLLNYNEQLVKGIAGWVDTSKILDKDAIREVAKNREIESSIENLELYDDMLDEGVYLYHQQVANSRNMQEGPINPQNNKFHRHLLTKENMKVDIVLLNGLDTKKLTSFYVSSLQALGYDVDKEIDENVMNEIELLKQALKNDKLDPKHKYCKVQQAINIIGSNGEIDINNKEGLSALKDLCSSEEHIYTLHALHELADLKRHIDTKRTTFTTDLPQEMDGITNGMILTLLQALGYAYYNSDNKEEILSKINELLNKGGIYVSNHFKKMNYTNEKKLLKKLSNGILTHADMLKIAQIKDFYNTLSDNININIDKVLRSLNSEDILTKAIINYTRTDPKTGELKGLSRNDAKPLQMVQIYGAKLYSIVGKFFNTVFLNKYNKEITNLIKNRPLVTYKSLPKYLTHNLDLILDKLFTGKGAKSFSIDFTLYDPFSENLFKVNLSSFKSKDNSFNANKAKILEHLKEQIDIYTKIKENASDPKEITNIDRYLEHIKFLHKDLENKFKNLTEDNLLDTFRNNLPLKYFTFSNHTKKVLETEVRKVYTPILKKAFNTYNFMESYRNNLKKMHTISYSMSIVSLKKEIFNFLKDFNPNKLLTIPGIESFLELDPEGKYKLPDNISIDLIKNISLKDLLKILNKTEYNKIKQILIEKGNGFDTLSILDHDNYLTLEKDEKFTDNTEYNTLSNAAIKKGDKYININIGTSEENTLPISNERAVGVVNTHDYDAANIKTSTNPDKVLQIYDAKVVPSDPEIIAQEMLAINKQTINIAKDTNITLNMLDKLAKQLSNLDPEEQELAFNYLAQEYKKDIESIKSLNKFEEIVNTYTELFKFLESKNIKTVFKKAYRDGLFKSNTHIISGQYYITQPNDMIKSGIFSSNTDILDTSDLLKNNTNEELNIDPKLIETLKNKLINKLKQIIKDNKFNQENINDIVEDDIKNIFKGRLYKDTLDTDPENKTNNNSQYKSNKEYINHSGGAEGTDIVGAKILEQYGIKTNHYYYTKKHHPKTGTTEVPKSKNNAPYGNIHITKQDYEEGQVKAAKYNYGYQYSKMYDPRLARNWQQVKNSDLIIAISDIAFKGDSLNLSNRAAINPTVTGGTGYAVGMAILHNKPIIVYNQGFINKYKQGWYKFDYNTHDWIELSKEELSNINLPKNFSVIGSRTITEDATKALEDFFSEKLNTKPKNSQIELSDKITRQDIQNNKNKIFVFGDNTKRKGYGGQAKEMRGELNTLGIATKRSPSLDESAFFNDSSENDWNIIKQDLDKLEQYIKEGKQIVLPKDGLGTGLAKLKEKAPSIYNYMVNRLNDMLGFEYMQPTNSEISSTKSDIFKQLLYDYIKYIKGGNSIEQLQSFLNQLESLGIPRDTASQIIKMTVTHNDDGYHLLERSLYIVKYYIEHNQLNKLIEFGNKLKSLDTDTYNNHTEINKAVNKVITDEETQLNNSNKQITYKQDTLFSSPFTNSGPLKERKELTSSEEVIDFISNELSGHLDPEDINIFSNLISNFFDTADKLQIRQFINSTYNSGSAHITMKNLSSSWINLSKGKYTSIQSEREVFLHEFTHLMTHLAFKRDSGLATKIYELQKIVIKKLLSDPTIDPETFFTDSKNPSAIEREQSKALFEYIQGNPEEFFTIAVTNKHLRKYIKSNKFKHKIKLLNNIKEQNIIHYLYNKVINIVNKLYNTAFNRTTNISKELENTLITAVQLTTNLYKGNAPIDLETKLSDKVFKWTGLDMINDRWSKLSTEINETLKRKGNELIESGKLDKFGNLLNKLSAKLNINFVDTIADIWKEISKGNNRYGDFYLMFSKAKYEQEKVRNDIEQTTKDVLNKTILNNLPDSYKKALTTSVLRTDLIALGDIRRMKKYFLNREERQERIKELESMFTGSTGQAIINQSKALGYFLSTGKVTINNMMLNAYNINNLLFDKTGKLEALQTDMTKEIDELITLYSINYLNKHDYSLAAEYMITRPKDFTNLINFIRNTINKDRDKLFTEEDQLHKIKGHIRPKENHQYEYIYIPESQIDHYRKYLYINPVPTDYIDPLTGNKIFIMKRINSNTDYTKGMMEVTQFNVAGDTLKIREELDSSVSGIVINQKIHSMRMSEPVTDTFDPEYNTDQLHYVPLFDPDGNIVDYRLIGTDLSQESYRGYNTSIEEVLANTHAHNTLKINGRKLNIKLFNFLKDMYEKDPYKKQYINIKDNENLWKIIPKYTKKDLFKIYGDEPIYVHKDLINDIFGYKDPSIVNALFINKLPETFKAKMKLAEKLWRDLVKIVKPTIAIANLPVIKSNFLSNVFVLNEFMSFKEIYKSFRKHWIYYDKLHKEQEEIRQLEIKRKISPLTKDEQLKLKNLKQSIQSNPLYPLVQNGLIGSIVEDATDIDEFDTNIIKSWANNKLQKHLPKKIKSIVDTLYLNQTDSLYHKMLKTVQYSDAIAKATLYEYFKTKGYSDKEALLKADSTFINYNINENKNLKYLSNIGLFMFSKFYLQTPKVIGSIISKNLKGVLKLVGINDIYNVPEIYETYNRSIEDALTARVLNPSEALQSLIYPALVR